MNCDKMLCALGLLHLLDDTQTCSLLSQNGFTTIASLKGIRKKVLRRKGIKHGHVNEIVNAVKQFSGRPVSAQRRHSFPATLPSNTENAHQNTTTQATNKVMPQPPTQSKTLRQAHSAPQRKLKKNHWKPRVFITYTWDTDEEQRDNRKRVLQLNNALRCTCKVETWIDDECMFGTLTQAMCNGIDNCDVVLVCITRSYIDKCKKTTNDNCKLELNYASERLGGQRLLPIVMESSCSNQQTWDGPVGAYLNKHVYIPCMTDTMMSRNVVSIIRHIEYIMKGETEQAPFPNAHLDAETILKHWDARAKNQDNKQLSN